jgi:hypothetical protein
VMFAKGMFILDNVLISTHFWRSWSLQFFLFPRNLAAKMENMDGFHP